MKRKWLFNSIFFSLVLLIMQPSHGMATIRAYYNLKCLPVGLSQIENQVSLVSCWYNPLPADCYNVAYINSEDKHLYATLLSAQMANRRVDIIIDDNAATVTLGAYGLQRHCKLLMADVSDNGF